MSALEKISLCALKSMTEAKQIKGVLNCLLENYAEENNEAVVLINLLLEKAVSIAKKSRMKLHELLMICQHSSLC